MTAGTTPAGYRELDARGDGRSGTNPDLADPELERRTVHGPGGIVHSTDNDAVAEPWPVMITPP
jgi:hypothetical protein